MKTFVIAEAAATHDGDLDRALSLVALAADIGADGCKFQWCSNPEKLAARRHAPEYLASYRLLHFPLAWHGMLKNACDAHGIEYLCTCYIAEDVPIVEPYVTRFKIASFEVGDATLLAVHRAFAKPIVFSTGMSAEAIGVTRVGPDWSRLLSEGDIILHCVSAYPAPVEEINLAAIGRLWRGYFGEIRPGLSDHTKHPWTGALAVAAGARVIEFHVRLDETDPANADYAVARTPEEARDYVANIRLAERMLGDGVKRVMPSEEAMLRYRVQSSRQGGG